MSIVHNTTFIEDPCVTQNTSLYNEEDPTLVYKTYRDVYIKNYINGSIIRYLMCDDNILYTRQSKTPVGRYYPHLDKYCFDTPYKRYSKI